MTNTIETKARDFMAEREEQRLGIEQEAQERTEDGSDESELTDEAKTGADSLILTDSRRIERNNRALIDKINDIRDERPDEPLDHVKRLAVVECLSDIENRLSFCSMLASSLSRYASDYIEYLGLDTPHEVEHIMLNLDVIARDLERVSCDQESVSAYTRSLFAII